ncbi:hypothetical protein CFK39_07905 [Brachybacterium avium]|uniref:DUF421 domain-containing protein n=1 Tax=Brachybacterium avium TaxID=2017485 RepID=A0A220UCY9_9MICO|nr:YetF domain-containing protein [Brachybacterium avium]ASK65772.1 hypothetical protein CFK39_07905 [Brachybacterium avium]
MDLSYFWTGWAPIWHTLLIGIVGYLTLVILLRGTGPRTMAKMTPLDFVIAVSLGSVFGRVVTAEKVSLAQAVVALVLLVVVQWVLAIARARWRFMRRLLDSPPVLLYYAGQLQHRALRKHRLTEVDVHTAARQSGHGSLAGVQAVVLHQDGSLGVIGEDSMGDGSSLLPFIERHRGEEGHPGIPHGD